MRRLQKTTWIRKRDFLESMMVGTGSMLVSMFGIAVFITASPIDITEAANTFAFPLASFIIGGLAGIVHYLVSGEEIEVLVA